VAFANGGAADALVVLAIITVVQQLEGHVVLPVVFGHTMRLHPLLVLLGVASGGLAFGIIGAFLAVPLIAVTVAIREELADDPEETLIPVLRGDIGDERD
jgi:predicted PurR-regulated permease PerM